MSSIKKFDIFCKKKEISVDIMGKIYSIPSIYKYRLWILDIYSLFFTVIIAYILKKIEFKKITIIGSTVYSKIVSRIMDTPLCLDRSTTTYVLNDENVSFHGPLNMDNDLIPLIQLTKENITKLEQHTNLQLGEIHEKILKDIGQENNMYLIDKNNLVTNLYNAPVTKINKIGNYYYIQTNDESWITEKIVTDRVLPLEYGDTIVSTFLNSVEESNQECNVKIKNGQIIVKSFTDTTRISQKECYYVDDKINKINIDGTECMFYSLKVPRKFKDENIFYVHPFHLPQSSDILLSIMIISKAISE